MIVILGGKSPKITYLSLKNFIIWYIGQSLQFCEGPVLCLKNKNLRESERKIANK